MENCGSREGSHEDPAVPSLDGLACHDLAGVDIEPRDRERTFPVAEVDGEFTSTTRLKDHILGTRLGETVLRRRQLGMGRHLREVDSLGQPARLADSYAR